MDWPLAQVVLEPVILGGLIIEEDDANPQVSSQFLENFRRNQTQSVSTDPQEGALVLIRTNGLLHQRNFILPAIIPNVNINHIPIHGTNRRAPIPLPEVSPQREVTFARSRLEEGQVAKIGNSFANSEMSPFQNLWSCECPVPGTQPLIACTECKRREYFEWSWDNGNNDSTAVLVNNDRDVTFNPGFSVGTVAVRGNTPLKQGYHHYWEVEMSSDVYGTDMMVGVGTDKTDLGKFSRNFVSLIGLDDQSWGLSYLGSLHHNGVSQPYTKTYGQYTVVGVHLDMWSGNLEFFINRKPIGKAFSGLQGKVLYPMISSTAARSCMNLIFCRSYQPTLQLQTMLSLGKSLLLPDNVSLFKVIPDNVVPPGLKLWMKNNFWWITSNKEKKDTVEDKTDKLKPVKVTSSTDSPGPSHGIRRARKTKKDQESDAGTAFDRYMHRITTRSMASRRIFVPGTNPIFAPAEPHNPVDTDGDGDPDGDGPLPAKSPRVSEISRPVTRSSSSPCVHHQHDDAIRESDAAILAEIERQRDLPPRASSSASSSSPEPGSKRMCLRSSKQDK